jgi:hypothetical protein
MKKRIATAFCILMLCGLLLITVETAIAAEPGYVRYSHPTQVTPTIDGQWTSPDEWTDGEETWIGTDIVFRSTVDSGTTRWIVEFLTDTTNNPGDYWQFCIDPHQDGGSEPQLGVHRMFKITGHNELEWYLADAVSSGWTYWEGAQVTIEWADSLSTSQHSSTPHWILEFRIVKNSGGLSIDTVWNFLLGAYDSSNPGFQSWPPTDPDLPDEWGIENYSSEPIPEGLTFGIMVLLSTVSMLVGYKYFAKRKETKTQ